MAHDATMAVMLCVVAIVACLLLMSCRATGARRPRRELRGGRLHVDGAWTFLKLAVPLRNFADERDVDRLIADLPTLTAKGYNAFKINCYWHHFDADGDGTPDVPLAPLARLVDAIEAAGAHAILSTETYGVGGGQIPAGFWKRHPDAAARDADGDAVQDDEYGFGGAVPSILHPEYRATTRRFIAALTRAIDPTRWLWFETTVEPQYMGNRSLDYTAAAKHAYETWLRASGTSGPAFPRRAARAGGVPRRPGLEPVPRAGARRVGLGRWAGVPRCRRHRLRRRRLPRDRWRGDALPQRRLEDLPRRAHRRRHHPGQLALAPGQPLAQRRRLRHPRRRRGRARPAHARAGAMGGDGAHDAQRPGLPSGGGRADAAQHAAPRHAAGPGVRQRLTALGRCVRVLPRRLVAQAADRRGRRPLGAVA
ncbi:MAG TPA: beta-galactosidase [Planctomycetota bacterium]|nr:beta-galactosidase [Planctomycetota bacterium]